MFHFLSFVFFNEKNRGFSKRLSVGHGNGNGNFAVIYRFRFRFRTLCATLFFDKTCTNKFKVGIMHGRVVKEMSNLLIFVAVLRSLKQN